MWRELGKPAVCRIPFSSKKKKNKPFFYTILRLRGDVESTYKKRKVKKKLEREKN